MICTVTVLKFLEKPYRYQEEINIVYQLFNELFLQLLLLSLLSV